MPLRVGNSGSLGQPGPFGEPGRSDCSTVARSAGRLVLAAFAVAADVRAGAEVDVAAGEAGQLGDPQPGLDGEQQQAWSRRPAHGVAVGGGEQRVDLGRR